MYTGVSESAQRFRLPRGPFFAHPHTEILFPLRSQRSLQVLPRAMVILGTVAAWEDWTEMRFPDDGPYVAPGALQPVLIDHARDEGRYEGPNVWMRHPARLRTVASPRPSAARIPNCPPHRAQCPGALFRSGRVPVASRSSRSIITPNC